MYVRNDGFVSINQTSIGAAKLEITGGTNQGIYAVSSNNIAVNGVGNGGAGFGVKGETNFGTALRANVTDNSGIALDLVNTTIPLSPIDLFKVLGDGRIFALPTYNDLTSTGTSSFLGIDSTGKLYNTNLNPTSFGNISGTGSINYIPKWISSNTLSSNSLIFDNGTNVIIGSTSSNSKFGVYHSGGAGDLLINLVGEIPYVRNYSSLLSVNNNGRIVAGYLDSLLASTMGHSFYAPLNATVAFNIKTESGLQNLFQLNTNGSFEMGHLASNVTSFNHDGISIFRFGGDISQSLGINVIPTANIHIVGSDSSSSNYSLKVENSSLSNLFNIRNDGNAYMGNTTPTSVVSPISLNLGGQYSNINGANPKLVIYDNGIGRSGFGVSYNGSGQTELFTRADNNAYDFTWYHGSTLLGRLGTNTLTLHRNDNSIDFGYAISFDLNNSSNIQKTYGLVSGAIVDNTAGSEDGRLTFFTTTNGILTEKLRINELGNVGIGTDSPTSKLDVRGQIIAGSTGNVTTNDSPFYSVRTNLGSPNYYTGYQFAFEVGGGIWGIGFNYANDQYQLLGGSTAKFIFGSGNPTTPNGKFIMDMSNGYFGSNTTSPSATIHGVGLDSGTSNYSLKIDNSISSALLHIRNDGGIYMLPTYGTYSNSGISSFLGIDSTGKLFNTNLNPTSIGNISGTGSINYIPRWVNSNTLSGTSSIYDNGTNIGIGIIPSISDSKLEINVGPDQRLNFRNVSVPTIGNSLIIQNINDFGNNVTNVVTLGLDWYHSSRRNLFSNIANIILPTAKVHIIGDNSADDQFALRVANLANNDLLSVRNDGNIYALPTYATYSNSGTSGFVGIDSTGKLFNTNLSPTSIGNVHGTGSANYHPRWVNSNTLSVTSSIYDDGTNIGIGTQSDVLHRVNIQGDVNIEGTLYATSKSFEIKHPLEDGKRLVYGSLEGPEYGIYHRGKLENNHIIDLPDYWIKLADENTITVNITPIGKYQEIYVSEIKENKVYLSKNTLFGKKDITCHYIVYAERNDIPKIKLIK